MGVHIENVNTEAACNEDNFELYESVDPPVDPPTLLLSFIVSLSFFLSLSPSLSLSVSLSLSLSLSVSLSLSLCLS